MSEPRYPTDDEVHAYVDDALSAERSREIARALQQDSRLAARVAAYKGDRDALRQALTGVPANPLPHSWYPTIDAAMARSPRALPRRRAVAACLALTAVAGATAALTLPQGDAILREALAARSRTIGIGTLTTDALPDEGARNALLRSALGRTARAPDLRRFGFQLTRFELRGNDGSQRSVQLLYRDSKGTVLTIYVRASNGRVHFDLLGHGSARICVWQDNAVGAVIIAAISAAEIMQVANSAYAAFDL